MLIEERESQRLRYRLRYRLRRERYADMAMRPSEADGPDPGVQKQLAETAEQVEKLTADNTNLRDVALRARAELDNARKRFQREKVEQAKYASEKVVRELIVVVDNLERALDSAEGIAEAKPVHDGVQMVLGQFVGVLKTNGLEVIASDGQPFDPHIHEAVGMEERDDVEPNTIVDTLQKGYNLQGRVVRAAMVRVAKAVSRPEEAPAEVATVADPDREDTLADVDDVETPPEELPDEAPLEEVPDEVVAAESDATEATAQSDSDSEDATVADEQAESPSAGEGAGPADQIDGEATQPDLDELSEKD